MAVVKGPISNSIRCYETKQMPNLNQKRLSGSIKNSGGNAAESSLLPVVPWTTAILAERELRRLEEIAAGVVKKEPTLAAMHAFGPHTRSGMSHHLWLVIGDTREIALTRVGHEITFEYRLSLLAREGDIAVFGSAIHHDFERYRSQQIGLGPIVSINVRRFPRNPLLPLAARCLLDAAAFSQIVERTKRASGLTIVPHIGMGSVWRLAAAVAEATGS